jgi:autotransporter passenger strand-loop-strand repeat protein
MTTYTAPPDQFDLVLDNGDILNVNRGGHSTFTTIKPGGIENVQSGGVAVSTFIDGGVEHVFRGGEAEKVSFDAPNSTLELATPTGLTGSVRSWRVGDKIDFLNTKVDGFRDFDNKVQVYYGTDDRSWTIQLINKQPNTHFVLQSDGHGGTDLILEANAPRHEANAHDHEVNAHHQEANIHFGPGPHFFF